MTTNTLETSYANGEIIDASHVNELTLALLGAFVGRDSSGVPSPNQSLGTLALPWGNIYATGIILGGLALDTSQITSLPNRVVSGKTRPLSSAPDFLRANGAALEFDILGASTDLVLSINNTAVTINSDLNKTGLTAAPAANNTCQINDTTIVNDKYAGEIDYVYGTEKSNVLTIDTVGTEITALIGQVAAFKTPTGEIIKAFVKSATTLTNVVRGHYFDASGNPLKRGNLSNNDVLTLMKIAWVFVEDNGTTVDVTYRTPTVAYSAPTSPQTADYWFDISNQVWKRYSGTSWDIINRILVGEVLSDATNTIASRSIDFYNPYENKNNLDLEILSTEKVQTVGNRNRISVYGTEVIVDDTYIEWNITTDLETGLIEAISTFYYLYLSDKGQPIISDERPQYRGDLKGYYHPYDSHRAVGIIYNDGSSDFASENNYFLAEKYNPSMTIPYEFSARVDNNGVSATILSANDGVLSTTNRTGVGTVINNFPTGFFKDVPAGQVTQTDSIRLATITTITVSQANTRTFDDAGTNEDRDYTLSLFYTGNQYVQAKIDNNLKG